MSDPYNRPKSSKVFAISIAVQVVIIAILFIFEPLRKSNMEFDPQEAKENSQKVAKANEKRKELDKIRKEKTHLKKEDAEKLKKKEKKKRKKKLAKKLDEMREINKELKKEKLEKLEALQKRTSEDIRRLEVKDLLNAARKVRKVLYHLEIRASNKLTIEIKGDCNELETSTEAFIDDLSREGQSKLEKEALAIDSLITTEFEEKKYPDDYKSMKYHGRETRDAIKKYLIVLEDLSFEIPVDLTLENLIEETKNEEESELIPIEEMSLEQVFEVINSLEDEIAEEYAEYKAAEIAEIQSTSFEDALEAVESSFGQKNDADGEQQGGEQQGGEQQGGQQQMTVGDLNRMREDLNNKTTAAMQSFAKAQNMGMQAGVKKSSQGRSAKAMKQQSSNGGSKGSKGTGEGAGEGGEARGRNSTGSTGTAKNATTKAIKGATIRIPEAMVKAKALPGRKFEKTSDRKGWLYLDTWYIIGPWENDRTLDYKVTHQPELEIDFDAEYNDGKIDKKTGKARELKWQFVQSNHMKIKMPDEQSNSTYYCYTEVYFEDDAELLLAIASDDAARLWVNDKLIWEDHGLSGWSLSEGFRSVKFKKGFNKIRVRIENFPKLCEFSVLLCPTDQNN